MLSFASDQKESIFDGMDLVQVFEKNSSVEFFPQGKCSEKSGEISETNIDEQDLILKSNNNHNNNNEDGTVENIEQPRPYDIICGRNSGAHNCVGNRRFRVTIMMNLKRYLDATTRE